ncbi:MAG: hypothetical protein MJ069_04535 [Salinivirgaceae bacterium]|nr:hypothetical protein [Salinivirgaceae bacterium]
MKLIDIQRHFFRIKGDENVYFCIEAETRTDLNVKAVNYIQANNDGTLPFGWETLQTRRITGEQLKNIIIDEGDLGMAYVLLVLD